MKVESHCGCFIFVFILSLSLSPRRTHPYPCPYHIYGTHVLNAAFRFFFFIFLFSSAGSLQLHHLRWAIKEKRICKSIFFPRDYFFNISFRQVDAGASRETEILGFAHTAELSNVRGRLRWMVLVEVCFCGLPFLSHKLLRWSRAICNSFWRNLFLATL